jgi:hypothetical protein
LTVLWWLQHTLPFLSLVHCDIDSLVDLTSRTLSPLHLPTFRSPHLSLGPHDLVVLACLLQYRYSGWIRPSVCSFSSFYCSTWFVGGGFAAPFIDSLVDPTSALRQHQVSSLHLQTRLLFRHRCFLPCCSLLVAALICCLMLCSVPPRTSLPAWLVAGPPRF